VIGQQNETKNGNDGGREREREGKWKKNREVKSINQQNRNKMAIRFESNEITTRQ